MDVLQGREVVAAVHLTDQVEGYCSIIIPVLNEADTIVHYLELLQYYRQAGHELILVDGGSQDNTVNLAETYVDRLVITTIKGRAHQMNQGAQYATGKVLLFLHADTCLPEDACNTVLASMAQMGRQWGRFNVILTGQHIFFRVIERMINMRSALTGIATGDQAMFINRTLFQALGGFPVQPLMEDIEMSTRLKKVCQPVCLKSRVTTSSRRWEENGIVKTVFLMWRLRFAYFLGVSPRRLVKQYYVS